MTTPRAIEIIHRDAHGFQGKMAIAEKKETQVAADRALCGRRVDQFCAISVSK